MTDTPRWRLTRALLFTLLVSVFAADVAAAQGIFGRARRAAERAAEREAERRAERAAENAVKALFDAGEDAIECLFTDPECIAAAQENGEDVVLVDDDGNYVDRNGDRVNQNNAEDAVIRGAAPGQGAPGAAASARPGEGAWANYDFVPGARPLYVEDFESDYVGNVPRRVDFQNGVMEVVSENGNQMLRFADAGTFAIPLPETLPERFTIEFDIYHGDTWIYTTLGTGPLDNPDGGYSIFHGDLRNHSASEFTVSNQFTTGVRAGETGGSSLQRTTRVDEAITPIRIAVDGSYVKMYVDEERIANIPNADIRRTDRILWGTGGEIGAEDDGRVGPVFVDNIRIAAGGREILYDQLQAEGRVATKGILFDTGSATIKPESTPTLGDIVRMMNQYGDLRLRIEGHTDNTGSADTNMSLSQRRAEAVVAYLTGQGVDGSRLEAAGMGQTAPVADNGTAEGRQQNRRVELVRL
ncbi:MAG: OmpA family protein [Bacteroidota bacterium]